MIGETVGGRYEILRALGEGGMGAVFEARHTGTGRRVALKVIHPDKIKSKQLLGRFEIEARAAGGVESEHVVQVFDVGVDEARRMPFLAMEYLTGEDLAAVMDRCGRLPAELALRIGVQICLGLEKAHAQGILHRDIKPANLLVAERDGGQRRMKIVDFGLAKVFESEIDDNGKPVKSLTLTGMLLGSPQYMSPEQARASREIDKRSDIWSVGMVLYEMVSGRTAFEDVTPLPKLLEAITSRPVPPIRMIVPEVELGIATAIERALEIDPARRYATVTELREALVVFLPKGWTLHESMFAGLSKPVVAADNKQPAGSANQAATVAKRAAPEAAKSPAVEARPAALAPVVGSQPAPPTKVSVQPRAAATKISVQSRPAATEPGIDEPVAPPQAALAVSGAARAPVAAGRSSLWIGLVAAGCAAVGLAAGAFWYLKDQGAPQTDRATSAAGLPSTPASATPPPQRPGNSTPPPPAAANPLLGTWKSDKGGRYQAVSVPGGVELRIADLEGFREQGYALHEARFTLRQAPTNPGAFEVTDHVRPLPPQRTQPPQLSYEPSSRATCVASWTQVDGRPLTATLEGNTLRIERAVVTAGVEKFELQNGIRIVACRDLARAEVKRGAVTLERQP